jgi:magnesium transporter
MLTSMPSTSPLSEALWIDLVAPTDDERASVEREVKVRLPTKADLEEIESSSRVYTDGGFLYLTTPVLETSDCLTGPVTVVGFVLSSGRLVTLRFSRIGAVDAVASSLSGAPPTSSSEIFLKIMEALVERVADALERANLELEGISHAAFHVERPGRSRPTTTSGALREALRKLGRMADGLSLKGATFTSSPIGRRPNTRLVSRAGGSCARRG